MAYLQTKITTFPALPIADVTPLEKLILSKVLDCAETDDGFEIYTDAGPMNPVIVSQRELADALDASGRTVSLLRNFLNSRVLSTRSVENADAETTIFIDLSEFPWQFIVQDIITRSTMARELVVIQWISDVSQRPESFGASVALITENGIFHATSEDLLAGFRKRDQALASGASNGADGAPRPHIDPAVVHADNPNDTVDALVMAEGFITGFEDDETQEGITDILAGLRAAIRRERLRPVLLDALKELRSAAIGFRDDAYRREPHLRVCFAPTDSRPSFAISYQPMAGGSSRFLKAHFVGQALPSTPASSSSMRQATETTMTSPLETMNWLTTQFRDRANDDPDIHTYADTQQVDELYQCFLDMVAALRVDLSMVTQLKSALLVGGVSDALWIPRAQIRERALLDLIARATGEDDTGRP